MIDPVVDIEWLERHRDEVALADVRWYLTGPPGREAYERGHIPGAVFVSLDDALAEPADPNEGRHPLPAPERFASALAEIGIGGEDTVVAYDDDGGVIAARLVWMLRALGSSAALLDGGLSAWTGSLRGGSEARSPARFTAKPWPLEMLASIGDVAALAARARPAADAGQVRGGPEVVLLDARDLPRYAGGEPDPVDPRAGHIPGARSLPARQNVGADGLTLSPSELRQRFRGVGVQTGTRVVSYCGSGVTACHNLLMLERAGLGPGRLYAGSWSQWSRDPDRPVETQP
jgi:thiosulfate/3-mercaptopyruvate sulfurtransferase